MVGHIFFSRHCIARAATVNTNTPRQHPFQKCIGFLLLFDQLSGSFHNKLLQVVRVLFHHVHDVVKDVCFPVEWTTTKKGHFVILQENKTALAEVLYVTVTEATFYEWNLTKWRQFSNPCVFPVFDHEFRHDIVLPCSLRHKFMCPLIDNKN